MGISALQLQSLDDIHLFTIARSLILISQLTSWQVECFFFSLHREDIFFVVLWESPLDSSSTLHYILSPWSNHYDGPSSNVPYIIIIIIGSKIRGGTWLGCCWRRWYSWSRNTWWLYQWFGVLKIHLPLDVIFHAPRPPTAGTSLSYDWLPMS